MTDHNKHILDTLNHLVEICEDGDRGYKNAADHLEHGEVKTILYRLSQQRALFAADLKNEILKLGGKPEESSTILGTLHRTWLTIKENVTSRDFNAILNECMRGEKAATEAYEKALKQNLPNYLEEMVFKQHDLIKGAYQQLQEFKVNPS